MPEPQQNTWNWNRNKEREISSLSQQWDQQWNQPLNDTDEDALEDLINRESQRVQNATSYEQNNPSNPSNSASNRWSGYRKEPQSSNSNKSKINLDKILQYMKMESTEIMQDYIHKHQENSLIASNQSKLTKETENINSTNNRINSTNISNTTNITNTTSTNEIESIIQNPFQSRPQSRLFINPDILENLESDDALFLIDDLKSHFKQSELSIQQILHETNMSLRKLLPINEKRSLERLNFIETQLRNPEITPKQKNQYEKLLQEEKSYRERIELVLSTSGN